ncbi:hypothetical protein BH09MYX1_BH09MYX1_41140 [soil metagenome]
MKIGWWGSLVVVLGCSKEPVKATASSIALPSASAASTASVAATNPPKGAELSLALHATPTHTPTGDSLKLAFVLTNTSTTPITVLTFGPLGFRLEATDPPTAKRITINQPTTDFPVQPIKIALAPGEARAIETPVTLTFDPTGKLRGGTFEWTVMTKKAPLALTASFDVTIDGRDGGTTTLSASTAVP